MRNLFLLIASFFTATSTLSQTFWSLAGNAGTTNSSFLGTTDNKPLIFKVNDSQSAGFTGHANNNNVSFGFLSLSNFGMGNGNTAVGAQALQYNGNNYGNVAVGTWALQHGAEGIFNTAIGTGAMFNTRMPGDHNVAVGQKALANNKKSENTAVGSEAAFSNTDGIGITAVGFRALNLNTTGEFNTAVGYQALLVNTTGRWNVALGSGSLQHNATGYFNTAGGNSSMHFNQSGHENTAFGEQSLAGNIEGFFNTALGCRSLWSVNQTPLGDVGYGRGNSNTAIGYEALREITAGSSNIGVGRHALRVNSTGNSNVAVGSFALTHNAAGNDNVAVGNWTLSGNTTGSKNTAVGHGADVSQNNLTNATAIGYGAKATASNQVTIGNKYITSIRGYVSWTTVSDSRIKKNIQQNVPGLDFIKLLNPVTYDLDFDVEYGTIISGMLQSEEDDLPNCEIPPYFKTEGEVRQKQVRSGFIAQEVEKAAQSIGYDFSGVDANENDESLYGLRYSELIVPLVKAVQELSEQSNAKDSAIALLQEKIEALTVLIGLLIDGENHLTSNQKKVSDNNISLEQNYPNPFNQTTVIRHTLPDTFRSAQITVTDITGSKLRQIQILRSGQDSTTIEAGSLPAGIYFYSLYVDNSLIDTKKMVLTK